MYLSENEFYKRYKTNDMFIVILGIINLCITIFFGAMAIFGVINNYEQLSITQIVVMILWLIGMLFVSLEIVAIGRKDISIDYVKGNYTVPNRISNAFKVMLFWGITMFVSVCCIATIATDIHDKIKVAVVYYILTIVFNVSLIYLIGSRRFKMKIICRREVINISPINKVKILPREDGFPKWIEKQDYDSIETIDIEKNCDQGGSFKGIVEKYLGFIKVYAMFAIILGGVDFINSLSVNIDQLLTVVQFSMASVLCILIVVCNKMIKSLKHLRIVLGAATILFIMDCITLLVRQLIIIGQPWQNVIFVVPIICIIWLIGVRRRNVDKSISTKQINATQTGVISAVTGFSFIIIRKNMDNITNEQFALFLMAFTLIILVFIVFSFSSVYVKIRDMEDEYDLVNE